MDMKRPLTALLVLLILSTACQNSQTKTNDSLKLNDAQQTSSEYKTRSGKLFVVHIDHSMGASICDVIVETLGFSANNTRHKLGVIDKIEKIFLTDLDNNGFEEIYIVTRSAGSGSYSTIYGIASNKDKSATPVYVRPISEKELEKGGVFEGFMGHNQFLLEDNKLVNSFPIYLDGDSNAKPTGGQSKIQYKLKAGEAGWILEPAKIIEQ